MGLCKYIKYEKQNPASVCKSRPVGINSTWRKYNFILFEQHVITFVEPHEQKARDYICSEDWRPHDIQRLAAIYLVLLVASDYIMQLSEFSSVFFLQYNLYLIRIFLEIFCYTAIAFVKLHVCECYCDQVPAALTRMVFHECRAWVLFFYSYMHSYAMVIVDHCLSYHEPNPNV
jgi:hypothetical protein